MVDRNAITSGRNSRPSTSGQGNGLLTRSNQRAKIVKP